MHFLPSLHILLTCSFVLVLAYLLSTIASFLASSFIHGPSAKASRQRRQISHNKRPPATTLTEPDRSDVDAAFMDRLLEEDEKDVDDAFVDAGMPAPTVFPHTPGSDLASSIFGDGPMEIKRDEYSMDDGIAEEDMQESEKLKQKGGATPRSRRHDDEEGKTRNGELGEADDGKGRDPHGDDAEYKDSENEQRWDKTEGETSKFSDAQGMSSPQQRLPPSWSDLEKLVNMNSKKNLLASAQPTLSED
ncbi:hypothetical protein GOP47_0028747 [Adiantum capillus-veneris]|nr:hypothetical protein GOP47_0028747 [Adiantum capillus-veneris]